VGGLEDKHEKGGAAHGEYWAEGCTELSWRKLKPGRKRGKTVNQETAWDGEAGMVSDRVRWTARGGRGKQRMVRAMGAGKLSLRNMVN